MTFAPHISLCTPFPVTTQLQGWLKKINVICVGGWGKEEHETQKGQERQPRVQAKLNVHLCNTHILLIRHMLRTEGE